MKDRGNLSLVVQDASENTLPAHAITLELPETLYRRFQQRSERTHRSLESEILDAVAAGFSAEDGLSPALEEAVAALVALPDDALWRLGKKAMSREAGEKLEALHSKQRVACLSQSEDADRARLMDESERTFLIPAQPDVGQRTLGGRRVASTSRPMIRAQGKQSRTVPFSSRVRAATASHSPRPEIS